MTVLITGIVLVAIGIFGAGVACGPRVKDALWRLDDRRRDALRRLHAPAPVRPAEETVPDHPRYGPLLSTPPQGIQVTRDDGVLSVKADQPVRRKHTEDHAPTCDFPAVPHAPEPPSWAQPPPSIEELRRQYDNYMQPVYERAAVTESVVARQPGDHPYEPAAAGYYPCCKHCNVSPCLMSGRHHVACIDCQPAEAEAGARRAAGYLP